MLCNTELWSDNMLCNTELWNGLDHRLDFENGIELKKALSECDTYRKEAILYAAKHDCRENVLCYAIEYNEWLDIITKIAYLPLIYKCYLL